MFFVSQSILLLRLVHSPKNYAPVNGNHVVNDDDPRLPHSRQARWFSCLHNVYSLTTLQRCRVQAHCANWWLWRSTCCCCLHRCNLAWQHKHCPCREVFSLPLELEPDGQLKPWIRVPMLAKRLVEINVELKLHNRSSIPHSSLTIGNP